jgi:hypothetical protein
LRWRRRDATDRSGTGFHRRTVRNLRSGTATAPPCVDPVRAFIVEVDGDVVYLKPADPPL